MEIKSVWAREILDSRGNPTVEVDVFGDTFFGSAAAPSGASTGKHEAVELRDGGTRYSGKGVLRAVENVNRTIAPAIMGKDVNDQRDIDKTLISLDGTKDKSRLGANAIVATSMACLRAGAASQNKMLYQHMGGSTLPHAMFNIINGGQHAGSSLAIQEFMIIPEAETFTERLRMGCEIYHTLKQKLVKKYGKCAINVGDEGGFAPGISTAYEALDSIAAAVEEAGYHNSCGFALDSAASSFYKNNKYHVDGKTLSEHELIDYYADLVGTYPIVSIEDPFHEESFQAFAALNKELPDVQIVGDDLVVTNVERIKQAIDSESMNALLMKINQIGTVSEAMDAIQLCRQNQMSIVVSHRSGETEDSFIADFSVGINAGQIKTGAPARGERISKYNQLLRIEERMQME
ncbi:phosphopyruvate hydratase [Candidatus Micrarchaeota archaeon]|nr:phosphopyruvate hydratase [Candidatus Micrarchaeota archaeon]